MTASAFSPARSTSSQPPMKAGLPPQMFSPFQSQHQQQMGQLPHPSMMELSGCPGPPLLHQHPGPLGEPILSHCTHQGSPSSLPHSVAFFMMPSCLLRLPTCVLTQLVRQVMLGLQEQRRPPVRAWPGW